MMMGFPVGSDGKESACNARDSGLITGLRKIPRRREWLPSPVFMPKLNPVSWGDGLSRYHNALNKDLG